MFRSRTRKIFRELSERKGRTAFAVAGIFIGVLGVVILMSVFEIVNTRLAEDLQEEELAMLEVNLQLLGEKEVDNDALISTLEVLPGVERVEGRISAATFSWKLPHDEKFEFGFLYATWGPFDLLQIEPMRLIAGRYPDAGRKEIAVEKRMANAQGLKIGDKLMLRALGAGAQEETWTVVGTVFNPYAEQGPPGLDLNEISAFATYDDAEYILGTPGLTTLLVRYVDFNTAEQQAASLVTAVGDESPYVSFSSTLEDPAANAAIADAQQTTGLLSVLGMIAMVVSGFLVTNIINAVVVEQRQQIGVMKSLGATRFDNLLMYVGVALAYGLIAIIPGVLLGVFLGSWAAATVGNLLTGTLIEGFNVAPSGIFMGILMGLIIPPLAAVIPVILGTRVTILEAMTDLGISVDYGRGLLARLLKALPLPVNVRQALSNITRKKGRLLLTWVTLALAAGVFMGVYGPFYSLDQRLDIIWDTFNYQIFVVPSESEDFEQVQTLATSEVPGIKAMYPSVSLVFEVEGYKDPMSGQSSLPVIGYDTRSDVIRPQLVGGTAWQADPNRQGIVLSSAVAATLEKKVGDRFVFSVGGHAAETEVIGIADLDLGFGLMNWQALAQLAESVLGEPLPVGFAAQMTAADPSVDEVDELIGQLEQTLGSAGITAALQNFVFFRDSVSKGINLYRYIFLVVVLEMAAVGAIGLLATLSMAVFERQKEIGVMRSIGAGSATIASQFLVEGNVIGILAWLVGIPLAFVVGGGLATMMPLELEALPPVTILVGLVGMVVVATISSLWPSLSAARKTVSEIIRYQ